MARGPHVYFLRPVGQEGPVKIGWSSLPSERLRTYQLWSPVPLELVARYPGDEKLEARFHARFSNQRLHGEWFQGSPGLTATIEAINEGRFDAADLPAVGKRQSSAGTAARLTGAQAAKFSRALDTFRAAGFSIPPDVQAARHTYAYEPEEKARRRAAVKAFVEPILHLLPAAKQMAAEREAARRRGSAPHAFLGGRG